MVVSKVTIMANNQILKGHSVEPKGEKKRAVENGIKDAIENNSKKADKDSE
jgi:hypothetical protein